MWPEITYTGAIKLSSITLPTFVQRERIELTRFQALVLDTQGSELLILKGAAELLQRFRFIYLEVSDFEFYKRCCLLPEVNDFMRRACFREIHREAFQSLPILARYEIA
jgi:2-O-methyltransferase